MRKAWLILALVFGFGLASSVDVSGPSGSRGAARSRRPPTSENPERPPPLDSGTCEPGADERRDEVPPGPERWLHIVDEPGRPLPSARVFDWKRRWTADAEGRVPSPTLPRPHCVPRPRHGSHGAGRDDASRPRDRASRAHRGATPDATSTPERGRPRTGSGAVEWVLSRRAEADRPDPDSDQSTSSGSVASGRPAPGGRWSITIRPL